jgi:hypothetical protein
MTPEEYKRAKRDVEGKDALAGCAGMVLIFGAVPVAFGFMGFYAALVVALVGMFGIVYVRNQNP